MTTDNFSFTISGWMAIATGSVYILAAVFLILFFTVGEPFGTVNDIFNGLAGISSGILAWLLYPKHHAKSASLSRIGLILAWVGVLSVILGSVLVVSGMTGWVLAGLYTSAGNALIGLWVLSFNHAMLKNAFPTRNLVILGLVAGALLTSGLVVLPGIVSGFDSQDTVPWYLYVAGLNALSGAIVYPIWCIRLGNILFSGKLSVR